METFFPQFHSAGKGFYKITVKVVDSDRLSAESHQVVNVTSEVDTVHGETYWLRDNVLSVVFMAIGRPVPDRNHRPSRHKPKEESECQFP